MCNAEKLEGAGYFKQRCFVFMSETSRSCHPH